MIITNRMAWGFIPEWIDERDERPMWEQVHENYAHGGGWQNFSGFDILSGDADNMYRIAYAGDPEMHEIGRIQREADRLIMFDHEWVLWQSATSDEWKMARID